MTISRFIVTLLCGALFGFGLAVSTMISPEVISSFLSGEDFGLLLVMGGGVFVTLVVYQLAPRIMRTPFYNDTFSVRPSMLDRDIIMGSALFGIGWGICGVCPGPAIAALGAGIWPVGYALIGMIIGAYLQGRLTTGNRPR